MALEFYGGIRAATIARVGLLNVYSRNMHNYSKRVDTEVKLQKLVLALGPVVGWSS